MTFQTKNENEKINIEQWLVVRKLDSQSKGSGFKTAGSLETVEPHS